MTASFETRIRIAELNIIIKHRHPATARLCRDYVAVFEEAEADLTVWATEEEIAAERASAEEAYSDGYLESVCIYRAICRQLPSRGALLFHAAVIADGEQGYGFSAPSGTGKSTHIRLWQETFGDGITVINGDKPILRRKADGWYAYGTPWCGKEGWHTNRSVRLAGLCFLERGEVDHIERLPLSETAERAIRQVIIPPSPVEALETLKLMEQLKKEVPHWKLTCTISQQAAQVARRAMSETNVYNE